MKVTFENMDSRVAFSSLNVGDTFIDNVTNPLVMIRSHNVVEWNAMSLGGVLYAYDDKDEVFLVECDVKVKLV